MLWGGWTGGGFFALFVLVGTPIATLSEGPPTDIGAVLFTIIFVGSIGSMVAFGIGAIVGLVVAVLDCCMLEVARVVSFGVQPERPELPTVAD
jgi:hypothetical protein